MNDIFVRHARLIGGPLDGAKIATSIGFPTAVYVSRHWSGADYVNWDAGHGGDFTACYVRNEGNKYHFRGYREYRR